MKAPRTLHALGQSLWLDNITRDLLTSGTLQRYIDELSVTGLTSNPIDLRPCRCAQRFVRCGDQATGGCREGRARRCSSSWRSQDLTKAADLFAPIHQRTAGVDGLVSLEVSPLLAHDTARTVAEAKALHAKANRPNLFIKIPGTLEGLPAIEEAIFAGVPVNVTLLFSRDHYLRGGGRLHARAGTPGRGGLEPGCALGRVAVRQPLGQGDDGQGAGELRDRLGIAVSQQSYKAYRDLLESDRWQRLEGWGARPQRLLFASTGTKDPQASDVLYIGALAAPNTVNTMPEETLLAFADHGAGRSRDAARRR